MKKQAIFLILFVSILSPILLAANGESRPWGSAPRAGDMLTHEDAIRHAVAANSSSVFEQYIDFTRMIGPLFSDKFCVTKA